MKNPFLVPTPKLLTFVPKRLITLDSLLAYISEVVYVAKGRGRVQLCPEESWRYFKCGAAEVRFLDEDSAFEADVTVESRRLRC